MYKWKVPLIATIYLTQLLGLSLNLQGLNKIKLSYLQEKCLHSNIYAIMLCETWLKDQILDSEVRIPNYIIYQSD